MVIILSPSKSLNNKADSPTQKFSKPIFLQEADKIVRILRNFSPANLRDLMNISIGLSELNYLRFQRWDLDHSLDNSKQTIFAFNGEVYSGLDAYSLSSEQIFYAHKHVRILSGLYGLLSPLDLIQPYRLEMGTALTFNEFKNLYQFWGTKICNSLNTSLENHSSRTIIHLASNEYAKAAQLKKIQGQVITPVFKELKGDVCKIITVYAKKARGLMTRYIIENKIEDPGHIKLFDWEGYAYSEALSSANEWVFVR
jgi:uncharacterized protein